MTQKSLEMAGQKRAARGAGALALASLLALGLTGGAAWAQDGVKAGTLTCVGEGGWGAIITSEKVFDCTYSGLGGVKEAYTGTIRKFGLDIGRTDKSALAWVVLGPETFSGADYVPGSLAGTYKGVGVEATVAAGVGAALLFGEDDNVFSLQPVSVQMQTGLGIAAGVQTMTLDFAGVVME